MWSPETNVCKNRSLMVCCNQEFSSATWQLQMKGKEWEKQKNFDEKRKKKQTSQLWYWVSLVLGSHTQHSAEPPGSGITTGPLRLVFLFFCLCIFIIISLILRSYPVSDVVSVPRTWAISLSGPLAARAHPITALQQTGGKKDKIRERQDCVSVSSFLYGWGVKFLYSLRKSKQCCVFWESS